MERVSDFVSQFTRREVFDKTELYRIDEKVFLASRKLMDIAAAINRKPFLIGTPLGKSKDCYFFPSIPLLNMIRQRTACSIWINKPTEWLYICGRDIFSKGIIRFTGHIERGGISLVLNQYGEVLGFGKIKKNLRHKAEPEEVVVENIFDIGDFLRRESGRSRLKQRRK